MRWATRALGDCATLVNGRAYKQEELLDSGTPVLRIQNLNGGDRWYYSDLLLPRDKYCEKGDLLFAWSASFGPYIWEGPRSIYHYHIWKVIPGEKLDKKFFYHLLAFLTARVRRESHGASMLHMTKARMEAMEIPLPPLEEQRRIAAMLDQCTILNASQELHLSKMRELEGGLLHQLDAEVQGESTTVALSTLTESGDKINYGVVQPGVHVDAGVPLIRVGDLAAGTVNRSALKSIDPSIESLYSRSRIRGNEILISCVGSIGLIAEVYPEDVGSNIARAVARVPVSKDVNRTWLAAYLRSRKVQRYFTNELRTVSQPTLNIKQIEETEITLPPLGRQQAFAIRLEMVQQKCAQRVRSLQTVRQLANALATQVFAGGD